MQFFSKQPSARIRAVNTITWHRHIIESFIFQEFDMILESKGSIKGTERIGVNQGHSQAKKKITWSRQSAREKGAGASPYPEKGNPDPIY
ncbi:MAG: hypothetical protein ACFFCS_28825 [Candidatus Hodarchaeota archaeon]